MCCKVSNQKKNLKGYAKELFDSAITVSSAEIAQGFQTFAEALLAIEWK